MILTPRHICLKTFSNLDGKIKIRIAAAMGRNISNESIIKSPLPLSLSWNKLMQINSYEKS
jgi:hypothetical protein